MRLSPFALIDRWLAPAPDSARVRWIGRHTYAHRGKHDGIAGAGVIENSASAFAAAIDAGLGIECDIQRSRDDVPMVFHDWDLQRLIGVPDETGMVSASGLKSMTYLGAQEGPITLSDLLGLVAGRVPLLIEIKSHKDYKVLWSCVQVRDALKGYKGACAVMSFDPRVSQWFARHAPQIVRGLVITEQGKTGLSERVRRHVTLWQAKPDFLAYDVRDLPSSFAAAQRGRGLPIATWTVKNPDLLAVASTYADAPIVEGAGLP